jgi:hypothetical protein
MRIVGLTFIVFGGLSAMGCTLDTAQGTYAGPIEGTEAWVAVSVGAAEAQAFVTGRGDAVQSYTRWMAAPVERDLVQLEADGWRLELFVNVEWASGDLIDPAGTKFPFRIDHNGDTGVTGLYAANDAGCRDGVIVLGDSTQEFESIGAWCDADGQIAPATPRRPLQISDQGVEIVAETLDGPHAFFAEEVFP